VKAFGVKTILLADSTTSWEFRCNELNVIRAALTDSLDIEGAAEVLANINIAVRGKKGYSRGHVYKLCKRRRVSSRKRVGPAASRKVKHGDA